MLCIMYIQMYEGMYVGIMYVCMYVCCMHDVWMMYICMYGCIYGCMWVCMHVCVSMCVCVSVLSKWLTSPATLNPFARAAGAVSPSGTSSLLKKKKSLSAVRRRASEAVAPDTAKFGSPRKVTTALACNWWLCWSAVLGVLLIDAELVSC
jgi:hypothetical protein